MTYAVITGASSGIGIEFARIAAAEGLGVVLVARTSVALTNLAKELKETFSTDAHVIACDLTAAGAISKVWEEISAKKLEVSVVINNAGVGTFGAFADNKLRDEQNLIKLNILALTQMCHFAVKHMTARGKGKILNVASLASFYPGPLMANYYASKVYVRSFSEALSYELKGSGVTVTALCPGPFHSGFQAAANMENSNLVKGKVLPSCAQVASYGYRAMNKEKVVAIHRFDNKFFAHVTRFLPRRFQAYAAAKGQRDEH